jgi:hypothetical protein
MDFPAFHFELLPVERGTGYGALELVALIVCEHQIPHVRLDLLAHIAIVDCRCALPPHPEFRVSKAVLLESFRSAVELSILQLYSTRLVF